MNMSKTAEKPESESTNRASGPKRQARRSEAQNEAAKVIASAKRGDLEAQKRLKAAGLEHAHQWTVAAVEELVL